MIKQAGAAPDHKTGGNRQMNLFLPAEFLLPKAKYREQWPVIACDQFTSQPEYWTRVRECVGTSVSSMHLILPEAQLDQYGQIRAEEISGTMKDYLKKGVFDCCRDSFVYVERTLANGSVRRGLVGVVDLEAYDYLPGSTSAVRATEETVVERIPPRKQIRACAPLELSHILLLCDDRKRQIVEPLAERKASLPKLYETELMEGGGRIRGWLVTGEDAEELEKRVACYEEEMKAYSPGDRGSILSYAVGDGNHSLATAKACYEALKQAHPEQDLSAHPARYAMVELENIHDASLAFTPIHRIVKGVDVGRLLTEAQKMIGGEEGIPLTWCAKEAGGTIFLDQKKGTLAVGILQEFLDAYLKENGGAIDYIHGEDTLKELAGAEDAVGFLLPPIEKTSFFDKIRMEGVLPRKTFSMGGARDKRYYLEARKIK